MKDLIIIGAGQAGLTMGYYLKQEGYNFLLLEAGNRIGDSWRNRYDSLQLFTPREYSSLPGMILKGERNGFPHKNEIVMYLEEYAQYFLDYRYNCKRKFKKIRKEKEIFKLHTSTEIFTIEKSYYRIRWFSATVYSLSFSKSIITCFFKYIHHNINHHHKFLREKY
ncbi:NAD(P)-binding domain-containing protein [Bacillus pacificus]